MLVQRVSAVADRAKAIKCGNPDRSGEIPVGAAAGRPLGQIEAQLARDFTRSIVQTRHLAAAFQGRPLEPA